jgi:catechol 2,3-dioxygenase-like lactoylglutathione lyase family enzyme
MVQHVSLESRRGDGDALVAFFALLGFTEVDPPPALRERARWLQAGDTQVHLLWADDPVVMPQGHIAVVAADYDATLDRLRDAGFEPEPRTEHWGAPRSYVRSPGGHRVELMASPPVRDASGTSSLR